MHRAHTDVMRFGLIGVTEGQFFIMGLLIATGYFGKLAATDL